MRAGISSEKSSSRRSGIDAMRGAGLQVQAPPPLRGRVGSERAQAGSSVAAACNAVALGRWHDAPQAIPEGRVGLRRPSMSPAETRRSRRGASRRRRRDFAAAADAGARELSASVEQAASKRSPCRRGTSTAMLARRCERRSSRRDTAGRETRRQGLRPRLQQRRQSAPDGRRPPRSRRHPSSCSGSSELTRLGACAPRRSRCRCRRSAQDGRQADPSDARDGGSVAFALPHAGSRRRRRS